MSSADHNTLLSFAQLALDYYQATQATKKAEARLEKAEDALRSNPELQHLSSSFNIRILYNHREDFAKLKQLHEEVKAAQLNERRCKALFFKAAKEVA